MKKHAFTLSCKTHSSASSTEPSQDALRARAFTLAEVLLTLAIIGVVAALTIPAVITKVTQDQYVVGLKKAYNTLKSVQRESEQENGPMENWNWAGGSKTTFEKYFKPHFDILKDCGATTDDGCFHKTKEWKSLNGDEIMGTNNNGSNYNFITSDGVAYSYAMDYNGDYLNRAAIFTVDVNGKKNPNTMGRDIFSFNVFRKAGIKPNGSLYEDDETLTRPSSDAELDCNTSGGSGGLCATKVLSEGAMNY